VLAPKGTPPAIVELLNRKLRDTLADPAVVARFEKGGLDAVTNSPSEYAEFLGKELEKWRRVIRERNIRAE
jgi:tripartite-type tricarboxylate transporter receptor subunit TctC